MTCSMTYDSPLGRILLTACREGLTGLRFTGRGRVPDAPDPGGATQSPILLGTMRWLDAYFAGKEPVDRVPLCLAGSDFQREAWDILLDIPYGETTTYGAVARELARRRGLEGTPARAVAGAIARNPALIIVPCHRVVGAGGNLSGYSGGARRKAMLLELEGRGRPGPAGKGEGWKKP